MDPDQEWTLGAMWALSLKLKDKLDKSNLREEELILLLLFIRRERKGREREFSKILSLIYGVSSVEIHRAINESSSTRRGLRVGIENMVFH